MALQFQLVQAPFRFGVEEGVDPKQVPFGTLTRAENVVWKKTGRLEKRQGIEALTTAISGGGNITSAQRLFVRGDELNVISNSLLYSYTNENWISRGRVPEIGLEWSTLQDGVRGAQAADIGYLSNGHLVYAWVTGDPTDTASDGDLYYAVIDPETGSYVTSPTLLHSSVGWHIRVVVSGTTWIVIFGSGLNLRAYHLGTTLTTLKTDLQNSNYYDASLDACVIGSEFVVAYAVSTGGIRLARYSFASTPVQQATATVTGLASTSIYAISVAGAAGETLYLGYADATANAIRFYGANPSTLAQTVAITNVEAVGFLGRTRIGICRASSTTCTFAYTFEDQANINNGLLRVKTITNAGAITNDWFCPYAVLLSRPFILGSRTYAVVATDPMVMFGADSFIVDITAGGGNTTPREVAKIDLDVAGKWNWGQVSEVRALSSTHVFFPAPYQSDTASPVAGWRQGIRLVHATIGASVPSDMWRAVVIGQEAYLSGGLFASYDGVEAFGYGFAHPPFVDEQNVSSSGVGGNMAAGTYLHSVTAERRTAAGVLHRGPVGVTVETGPLVGATSSVTVAVVHVPLSLSSASATLLPLYRTTVDGETLHRLTLEPNYASLYGSAVPTWLSIVDTSADNSIEGTGVELGTRELLYTEGGELEDQQPPGLLTCTLYRERIFAIGGDRRTIWFTKCHADNPGVAPGFSTSFRITFNDTLTALAVLDERLVVFSETGIYYMAGDGPAPNGESADYNQPNKLQTDVGCTNPRSVVSGPDGIFFEADGGIQILDRGMSVVWVGKPVQDVLETFPTITSAVLVSKKNHARFSCVNEAGTYGCVLVFDYVEKQWSTFYYAHDGSGGAAIADACMHDGAYTFVTTSGVVYKEDDATHLDDGAWVTARLETAWVHAAGPLAYHSVRNFRIDGDVGSSHALTVEAAFDGADYDQTATWPQGTTGVTSTPGVQTANVSINTKRKCRSIRFRIEDGEPSSLGTGQGPKWSSMGIEVGVKRGLGVLPKTQKG